MARTTEYGLTIFDCHQLRGFGSDNRPGFDSGNRCNCRSCNGPAGAKDYYAEQQKSDDETTR